jgi:nicotinamidase-related amidase
MELVGSPQAGRQAQRLLEHFRQAGLPVVHVQHIATRPGATFFLPDTEGVKTHSDVQPIPGETLVVKHFPNSFRETPLLDTLRQWGVNRLAIAGMMTHMCVDATTRAAADLGFECLIAGEACATRDLSFAGQLIPAVQVQGAFLAALNGTYGKVLEVEDITGAV